MYVLCMISGFRRGINEICALLGFHAAQKGNFLPTFRDNLSVLSSKVQQSNKASWNILRYVYPKRGLILSACYVYSK